MDKNMNAASIKMLERTKNALEKNNMNAYIALTKEEAVKIAESLITEGATVSCGGSMTLAECGMTAVLNSGKYNFLDREKAPDKLTFYRESYGADYYMCSSNAVTENGELYNVDGNGNRVSCICYGPSKVIMIVGRNKIVHSLDEAIMRVKRYAAPANCQRLSCKTFCSETGICKGAEMTQGCGGEDRICSTYVVCGHQRNKGRISVILVNEELGY